MFAIDELRFAERYRGRGSGYRCPACLQKWFSYQGLIRHMRILHHKCRFCPKAYIRVERHEKLMHTNRYAVMDGACESGNPETESER